MCSGGEEDNPAPAKNAKDSQSTGLPVSHHAIAARAAALPTVPERRRTAGSGLPAGIPTLFGVSLSQDCHGRRRHPTWGPWPSSAQSTGPATPSTPCSTRSSPSTWRSSCARWRRPATGRACRSSSSASSESFCCVACSRPAWRGFGARAAPASTWCRFRAKGARGVPVAARMTERAAHLVDAVLPWVPATVGPDGAVSAPLPAGVESPAEPLGAARVHARAARRVRARRPCGRPAGWAAS